MKKTFILAALGITVLTACGSKTDANEKNFGAALTQYLEKKGELCLHTISFPVDLSETDIRLQGKQPGGIANEILALEAVGLAKAEDTEVQRNGFDGNPTGPKFKVKRYTLTEAAKPYTHEKEVEEFSLTGKSKVKKTDLCWGKKALAKVVKWEGPMKFGDYQEARVTYTYKIDQLADWAKKPELQAAFSAVKTIVNDAGTKEDKHTVKLTSQGWEAKGLD